MRALIAVLATTGIASAEPVQLGGFVGGRLFSDDSRLGFVPESRGHPSLDANVAYGVRVAYPALRWLVPELELAFARTDTNSEDGVPARRVTWLEPRAQVRVEPWRFGPVTPFAVLGAGLPIVVTPDGHTMQTGVTGEGYGGLGVRVEAGPVRVRLDARLHAHPGIEYYTTYEVEVALGLEVALGGARRTTAGPVLERGPDRDRDGVVDRLDKCPDREEDRDTWEDGDGCPDIDNDLDHALDIADPCVNQPETFNGYLDDDGCPDELPADVTRIVGVIAGATYDEGATNVSPSAVPTIQQIASVLLANPKIRVTLIGHTDDREFLVQPPVEGDEAQLDPIVLAEDLARARAQALAQVLIDGGNVPAERIVVESRGAEQPIGANGTPEERATNRRVELRIFVAPH